MVQGTRHVQNHVQNMAQLAGNKAWQADQAGIMVCSIAIGQNGMKARSSSREQDRAAPGTSWGGYHCVYHSCNDNRAP